MLSIEHLSKTYSDGTCALSDVSVSVQAGEIVALIGGSGCGKTTLLRLISGLDHTPDGVIRVDNDVIHEPHPMIGIVFQEARLFPWLSVSDNVGFGLSDVAASERGARVHHALEKVGLREHGSRWPRELSGGQQQRVAIARAFVTNPKVMLLDEPFSALDAFTRQSLHAHLLSLWEEHRPTILMVTHDVEEAVALADRVLVMQPNPGRVFDEMHLGLSRPRDLRTAACEAAKRRILNALDQSLKPNAVPRLEAAQQSAAHWW
jgi:sulfonate transport system ATP-binding protein